MGFAIHTCKMSFFIRKKNNAKSKDRTDGKRKNTKINGKEIVKKKKKSDVIVDDEEIASDSDIESDGQADKKQNIVTSSSEDEEETAQEKKLRLAKQYLAQLKDEEDDSEEESSHDVVADRLKRDLLDQAGKLWKEVADGYIPPEAADITRLRGHQLPITCLVITPDDKYIFTASKDCSIIKWDMAAGKRIHTIAGGRKGTEDKHVGHTTHVLCLAISSDGQFLVSGDRNKLIHVWNPETCQLIHTFTGHRDAVSGLAFRKGTHQLFSASHDRSVKIWTLDEMAYIETLFGHQDVITGIDSLTRERAVTSGGRDGSVRIWKVIEESQLIFHGHMGSIDCVSLINEGHFISGADDNSLALWSIMKKKPLVTVSKAHTAFDDDRPVAQSENWITAVQSLQSTDLIASGSKDGQIRLWKCDKNFKSLTPLFSIPIVGFVNDLKFSSDGSTLVAGIGQEHKLGRWWRIKEAKNGVAIIRLHKQTQKS